MSVREPNLSVRADVEGLYRLASEFTYRDNGRSSPVSDLYRNKQGEYWAGCVVQGWERAYPKDANGHKSNPLNEVIHGLFFGARSFNGGGPPTSSPFGDTRVLVAADLILAGKNLYFSDFYCNQGSSIHYLTIVVCSPHTWEDDICSRYGVSLWPRDNKFLWRSERGWRVTNYPWVEILYTENVPIDIYRFVPTKFAKSKMKRRGLANNAHCLHCNLPREQNAAATQSGDGDPDDVHMESTSSFPSLSISTDFPKVEATL